MEFKYDFRFIWLLQAKQNWRMHRMKNDDTDVVAWMVLGQKHSTTSDIIMNALCWWFVVSDVELSRNELRATCRAVLQSVGKYGYILYPRAFCVQYSSAICFELI